MKTVLYFFLFSILFLSCQKQVDENKDLKKLNDDILFLLKKTDSLASSIALNISGISKISIKELAEKIGNKLNASLSIPENDSQGLSGNPKLVNIGLQKYIKEFNKETFVDMDEGLDNTIAWQKYILI